MAHRRSIYVFSGYSLLLACVCALLFAMIPQSLGAQSPGGFLGTSGSIGGQTPTLEVRPSFPGAVKEVTLTIPGTVSDTSGGTRWSVDGIAQTEAQNQRSITLTTGELGSVTRVQVTVINRQGAQTSLSHTITPTEVDFIVESQTMAPYFYEGRSLPSRGAPVTITAIPHTGTSHAHDALSYKWTVDQKVLGSGSARGNNQVTLTAPLGRSAIILLSIYDPGGVLLTTKVFELAPSDPIVRFYEANPLRGITPVALSPRTSAKSEYTLQAVPYHLGNDALEGEHRVVWSVDGRSIQNTNADPFAITLRNTSENDTSATISFAFNSLVEYLQFAEGVVGLNFRNDGVPQ